MTDKQISNAPPPIRPLNPRGISVSTSMAKPEPSTIPADYETWCKTDLWTVKRGIFLLLNVEDIPRKYMPDFNPSMWTTASPDDGYSVVADDFNKIWAVAESSLKTERLKVVGKIYNPLDANVLPSVFIAWARLKKFPIPPQLESISSVTQVEQPTPNYNQDHISEDLATLNNAAHKFWANADKNDKDTHPKQQDVIDWLKSQDFSDISAKQGAVIIRPKWAADGRRPKE